MLKKFINLQLHWQILVAIVVGWIVGKITGTQAEFFGVAYFEAYKF